MSARPLRALCLLSALCACSATSDRDDGTAELEGRQFVSASVEGFELVEGTEIRLGFHAGSLSAYAGCNHFDGTFQIEGGVLKLTGLGSTEIGCEPALAAQDTWLSELLTGHPQIRLEGDQLVLTTGDVQVTFLDREVASPDRPLVGTHWIGNGTGDDVAISFSPGAESVSVLFGEDGQMTVFTGCQDGDGAFTSDATTITFPAGVQYDTGGCSNPQLESVASQVRTVLSGDPVSYEIEEANLTLIRAGKRLLFREEE